MYNVFKSRVKSSKKYLVRKFLRILVGNINELALVSFFIVFSYQYDY